MPMLGGFLEYSLLTKSSSRCQHYQLQYQRTGCQSDIEPDAPQHPRQVRIARHTHKQQAQANSQAQRYNMECQLAPAVSTQDQEQCAEKGQYEQEYKQINE
jgi:hypothetical protein